MYRSAHHSMTPLTPIDELDKTYGRLTVVEYLGGEGQGEGAMWKCECECGRSIEVRGSVLRQGKVKSCGRCRKRNHKRLVKWESPELMLAIMTVGTPPCDVGFGCPHWSRCATERLACDPFWKWVNYGGKAHADPSQKPNAAIYKRIFRNAINES